MAGLVIALVAIGAVRVLASYWVSTIGVHLDPEDAFEKAPRPPGFAGLVEPVYQRRLLDEDPRKGS